MFKSSIKKKIYVATDDNKIMNFCKKKNILCLKTSKKCTTGTDRIYEFSEKILSKIYINVQGDEPILNPQDLKKMIKNALKFKNTVLNGYCKINRKEFFFNRSIPKVIFDKNKDLLYMSRAAIPHNKLGQFKVSYRQVCIYSFPRKKLKIFSKNLKTQFENIEDIEILRFIENGEKVKMIELSSKSIAVDTLSDIKKVEKKLKLNN